MRKLLFLKEPAAFYEALIVVAVTLVAGFLRIYQLESIPPGLHGDEAIAGLEARRILDEGYIGPYVGSALGQAAGAFYWTALVLDIFGSSAFSVRLSMAILGALTVLVSYFLFRSMFNCRVAFIGAMLTAFSYWHLTFSRVGFPIISLPLAEVLCLLFLFRGLKRGNIAYFAAAGLFFGGSVYTYNVFPLFLLTVLLFLAFIVAKRGGGHRISPRPMLTFFLAAFITALPMLVFAIQNPGLYSPRFTQVLSSTKRDYLDLSSLSDNLLFVLDRLGYSVSLFLTSGQPDGVDGLGWAALLDPMTGILFIAGMLISFWKLKDERYFLVLAGIATGLLGIALLSMKGSGEYRRGITALPLIMLAAALGLEGAWGLIKQRFGVGVGYSFLALALLFVFVFNVNYYFRDWAEKEPTRWVYCHDLVQALNHVKRLDTRDARIYFFSDRWSYNYETRKFLLPDVPGEDRSERFGKFSIEKDAAHKRVVYLIMSPYNRFIPQVQEKYPGGEYEELKEGNRLIYAAYYVK